MLHVQRETPVHRNRKLNNKRNDKVTNKIKQLHPVLDSFEKQATAKFAKEILRLQSKTWAFGKPGQFITDDIC